MIISDNHLFFKSVLVYIKTKFCAKFYYNQLNVAACSAPTKLRYIPPNTPLQTAPIKKLFRQKLQRLISRILAICNQTGIIHINVVMNFLRFQPPTISTPLGLKSPKTNQFLFTSRLNFVPNLLQSVERCGLQRTHKIAIHTYLNINF